MVLAINTFFWSMFKLPDGVTHFVLNRMHYLLLVVLFYYVTSRIGRGGVNSVPVLPPRSCKAPGHQDEADVWYAGASPQGLFRSEDGGSRWEPVSGFNDHPNWADWTDDGLDDTPDGASTEMESNKDIWLAFILV